MNTAINTSASDRYMPYLMAVLLGLQIFMTITFQGWIP